MENKFKIGDEVVVSKVKAPYSFTKFNSRGIVTKTDNQGIWIDFHICTGDPERHNSPHHYFFYDDELSNFSVLKAADAALNPADKKYEKIILKIKQMKDKRKANGYAY